MTPAKTPDIDSMTARELDAAVAEKVMEWTLRRFSNGGGEWLDAKGKHIASYDVPERFSSDWSATAMVIERMREMGWEFRCHGPQELYSYWEAFFTMPGDEWPIREVEAKGDTFPTAVCRAALKARESK